MTRPDALVRLEGFQSERRRPRRGQSEAMFAEVSRMVADLGRDRPIQVKRSGIADAAQFAYST